MINKIKQYISKNNLFSSNDKLLVAVSAGIDSMFLLHVLMKLDYKIEVIHCNFSLRAAESDNDQKFIEEFTSNNKI